MKPKSKFHSTNLLLVLLLNILILMLCLDVAQAYSSTDSIVHDENRRQFDSIEILEVENHLIAKTQLNGKKAYFLIDTGASCSVLHSKSAKYYGYTIIDNRQNSSGGSATIGRSSQSPPIIIHVDLVIGSVKISRAYLSQDLSRIRNVISKKAGISITGILGSDILKTYNAILDLRDNELLLSNQCL